MDLSGSPIRKQPRRAEIRLDPTPTGYFTQSELNNLRFKPLGKDENAHWERL